MLSALKSDILASIRATVTDADESTLSKMGAYGDSLSVAIDDYVKRVMPQIPDHIKGVDGYSIVSRNGVYKLEPNCCGGSGSFSFTPSGDNPDESGPVIIDDLSLLNPFLVEGNLITTRESYVTVNGVPQMGIQSHIFSYSPTDQTEQDALLLAGDAPYFIAPYFGDIDSIGLGFTLKCLLHAPRTFDVILAVNGTEYALFTMDEDSDPDDFTEELRSFNLSAGTDFENISFAKGDLVQVRLRQTQYEIADISVCLSVRATLGTTTSSTPPSQASYGSWISKES
jgi:hypothetical protein